jgi:hypothetical protein
MNTSTIHRAPRAGDAKDVRSILQEKLTEGLARAASVITTIHNRVPKDQIAPSKVIAFTPADSGLRIQLGTAGDYTMTSYAFGQVATRGGVPTEYARALSFGEEWQRTMAADILSRSFAHSDGRVLARSVDGRLIGMLSDKYRRLDERPLVDTLVKVVDKIGAKPFGGTATETRVALKVVIPEIIEPVPGEPCILGGEWSNSNVGNGVHGFRSFIFRLVCLNGATGESALKEVHIGGKLSDEIEYSQKTYDLDSKRSQSALTDIVSGCLSKDGIAKTVARIQAAAAKEYNHGSLANAIRSLGKGDQKLVLDAFDSEDVINLPAGDTAWRASNAISWVARNSKDDEKRLDLERLAGAVLAA